MGWEMTTERTLERRQRSSHDDEWEAEVTTLRPAPRHRRRQRPLATLSFTLIGLCYLLLGLLGAQAQRRTGYVYTINVGANGDATFFPNYFQIHKGDTVVGSHYLMKWNEAKKCVSDADGGPFSSVASSWTQPFISTLPQRRQLPRKSRYGPGNPDSITSCKSEQTIRVHRFQRLFSSRTFWVDREPEPVRSLSTSSPLWALISSWVPSVGC